MPKNNIALIQSFILIVIIALFTTSALKDYKRNEANNDIVIASSTTAVVESLIDNIPEEPEKEFVWVEPVNYTLMTKSQISERTTSLLELIEVTEKWQNLGEVYEQAVKEFDNAMAHLEENNYLYPYSEEDLLLLSYMIEIEAGASIITDEEQCLVGCVIINRRNQGGINKNLTNPSIKDIINEAGQYSICRYNKNLGKNTFYVDTDSVDLSIVSDRSKENARKVLEGEFTCPENVVFQALFTQGEVYKSFYHGAPFNNTTYFCYGR